MTLQNNFAGNRLTSSGSGLKILALTSSYPKFPGDVTAPFIEAITQNIQALGHSVSVVMPYHPELKRRPVENGVKLYTYSYAPFKNWNVWGYASSLRGDIKVRKVIYLLLPFVLARSFIKLWKLSGKEQFDLIQAHWVIPNAPVAIMVGSLRKLPVVISLHGSDVYLAEKVKPVGWVARWAFKRAAAVTASSQDLLERAQKMGASLDPGRGVLIPYGADPASFNPLEDARSEIRQSMGIKEGEKILYCCGRLVYKKGFEYAIRALPEVLSKLPEVKLIITGKGDLEAELKALAVQLGVEKQVRFEGAVPHTEIPHYLAACDLFLLPSVIDKSGNVDGLPNTLLEAMAAGRPVVASEVAGVPLAVQNGRNGRLVPPGDPEALAGAVVELLENPGKAREFGRAGREKIEKELNWKNIARRYVSVFQRAVKKGK